MSKTKTETKTAAETETEQTWKAGDRGTAEWCAKHSRLPDADGVLPDGWQEVGCCICRQPVWWHTRRADVKAYQIDGGYMACQICIAACAEGLIWCVAEAGFISPPDGVVSSDRWCCHHQGCPKEFLL